jgi:U3 small nucleolar RNA-associated protein 20
LFLRSSEKQLTRIASQFPSIPITPLLHTALLKFSTAALTAGDTSLWLGPGRKIIERSWISLEFGINLCGVLGELGWGGWKMIALPSVLKMTPRILEEEPKKGLRLLNALEKRRMLGEVDIVLKGQVENWVQVRLKNWEQSEQTVSPYYNR